MIIVEEMSGGHSPMMRIDGFWCITENVVIENDIAVENPEQYSDVWFNATKDVGGYCEGTWYFTNTGDTKIFNWGVNDEGTVFIIKGDNGEDITWDILELNRREFRIQRTEGDIVHDMTLVVGD